MAQGFGSSSLEEGVHFHFPHFVSPALSRCTGANRAYVLVQLVQLVRDAIRPSAAGRRSLGDLCGALTARFTGTHPLRSPSAGLWSLHLVPSAIFQSALLLSRRFPGCGVASSSRLFHWRLALLLRPGCCLPSFLHSSQSVWLGGLSFCCRCTCSCCCLGPQACFQARV